MKYLLDTNVCIAGMRNHPQVVARIVSIPPGDLAISTVTSYELFTGIAKCSNPAKERAKIEKLLQLVLEVPFDPSAAREAASIRAALEAQGRSIGPYDLLLAGHAISLGLILITNNTTEFSRIAGLLLEDWHNATP